MTAEEWERCTSLRELNEVRTALPRTTTRKAYCFALACARLVRDQMPATCRHALDVTERYVERQASNSDRAKARAAISNRREFIELIAAYTVCAPGDISRMARDVPFWIIDSSR